MRKTMLAMEEALGEGFTPNRRDVKKLRQQNQQHLKSSKFLSQKAMDGRCHCCGGKSHEKKDCRLKDQECYNCGKVGHTARMCRAPKKQTQLKQPAKSVGGAR